MTLNTSKCYLMQFTNKKKKIWGNYNLNQSVLQTKDRVKYLGITFTAKLDWTAHVDGITARASCVFNLFKRNFKHTTPRLKETLYFTNVRPILEYGCVCWDPFTNILKDKLERVQKRAARFVTGNYNFKVRGSELREALGWKLLSHRRKVFRIKFLYDIYKNKTGINKSLYLRQPHYVSSRRDNTMKIRGYNCRINTFKYSFFPNTISDWNLLPNEVFESENFQAAIDLAIF